MRRTRRLLRRRGSRAATWDEASADYAYYNADCQRSLHPEPTIDAGLAAALLLRLETLIVSRRGRARDRCAAGRSRRPRDHGHARAVRAALCVRRSGVRSLVRDPRRVARCRAGHARRAARPGDRRGETRMLRYVLATPAPRMGIRGRVVSPDV